MRVIAGKYKSRQLKSVKSNLTRPTTDRNKENLFNIIGPYFDGGAVLDLFAGSGGLGIEALSRGYEHLYSVDNQYAAFQVIKENFTMLKLANAHVYKLDYRKALKRFANENHLLGQLLGQGKALGGLRVGGFHGGEGAVNDHLFRHAVQVPDAQLLQHIGNLLVSRAVEGGVDHAEGVGHLGHGLPVVNLIQHVGEEFVIGLPAQQGDEPLGPGLFVVHGPDIVKDIQGLHLGGDGRRVLGGQLGAVGPIDLVAIVLRGIVAGGDVESGHTAVLPHGEGELRRGAHGLKKAHGDAVGGHHPGGGPGKFLGVNAEETVANV